MISKFSCRPSGLLNFTIFIFWIVGCLCSFAQTVSANGPQLAADGPFAGKLRENCISNINKLCLRTTEGHLWLGAVIGRGFFTFNWSTLLRRKFSFFIFSVEYFAIQRRFAFPFCFCRVGCKTTKIHFYLCQLVTDTRRILKPKTTFIPKAF